MKLYYSKGSCSLAVQIILNELNVEFEMEAVNLKTKQTAAGDDFYTINPKGSVPVLITNNNETLTENAVIQQYLADTFQAFDLLPKIHQFERYRVLEWLNFVSTDLHKTFGPLFNPTLPAEVKSSIFVPIIKARLDFVEKHLQTQPYLANDHFTLPDAYFFVILTWLSVVQLNIQDWAAISAYFDKLKMRPSIIKSLEQQQAK